MKKKSEEKILKLPAFRVNLEFTPESLLGLEFCSYLLQVVLALPKLEFFF